MPYRLFPRRLRERVGRRGLVLILFGIAWLIQGAAHFLVGRSSEAGFIHDRLPAEVVGGLWIGCGLASILVGFSKKRSDAAGFLSVSMMPMFLGASYLVGAIRTTFGDAGPPVLIGILGASIWGVITLVLAVIASWPEAPTTTLGGEDE